MMMVSEKTKTFFKIIHLCVCVCVCGGGGMVTCEYVRVLQCTSRALAGVSVCISVCQCASMSVCALAYMCQSMG